MTLYWIYDLPDILLGALIMSVWIAVGLGGLRLVRSAVARMWGDTPQNDVVSFFFAGLGVFYGITLGLIAIGAWEDYSDAGNQVGREAATIATLWRDVASYPEPIRTALHQELLGYTRFVIDSAWPVQSKGKLPMGDARRLTAFQDQLFAFNPASPSQTAMHAEALRAFNALVLARSLRLELVDGGLPAVVWWVVLIGGVLNVAITWLFVIRPPMAHVMLTGSLSALIGLLIFLIAAMDNPLRGEMNISPTPYQIVYERLMTADIAKP
ncbi:MAG: hypothetical protein V4550_07955 [Gemmatimonadota bacterium]